MVGRQQHPVAGKRVKQGDNISVGSGGDGSPEGSPTARS